MDPKLKYLLTSRKFWAAIVGLVVLVVKAIKPDFPLSEPDILPLVLILVSYILGTAVEDAFSTRSNVKPPR